MKYDLSKMINWEFVDEKYNYALVFEDSISFYCEEKLMSANKDSKYEIVKRPRKFEDGASYAFTFDHKHYVGMYDTDSTEPRFLVQGLQGDTQINPNDTKIGQKLPDSLWDKE